MKKLFAFMLLTSCAINAQNPVTPSYSSEAPLPKGWPQPGPYNQVAEKSYPKYRAAITQGGGNTMSFWRLFGHIKKKDIPMTAPVEMALEEKDDKMKRASMAFLYQNTEVGTTGADGSKIAVEDIKPQKVLSYTWMGDDNDTNMKKAKAALEASLKERKLAPKSFRLLGYNGPGTPKTKRTYELQAILENK